MVHIVINPSDGIILGAFSKIDYAIDFCNKFKEQLGLETKIAHFNIDEFVGKNPYEVRITREKGKYHYDVQKAETVHDLEVTVAGNICIAEGCVFLHLFAECRADAIKKTKNFINKL